MISRMAVGLVEEDNMCKHKKEIQIDDDFGFDLEPRLSRTFKKTVQVCDIMNLPCEDVKISLCEEGEDD
jgi:hypothetical protein